MISLRTHCSRPARPVCSGHPPSARPSGRPGRRQRFRGTAVFGLYIVGGRVLADRKRVIPYSIQTLKRLKPAWLGLDRPA